MRKPQQPTVQQLVDIIKEYNRARELELRMMPVGGFPPAYKNALMDNLYDVATGAAAMLKPAVEITIEQRDAAPR